MPIYEYRCSSCGHQQEFLQKVSDAPVTVCTGCGQATFSKMLTAAGFHLKGSGWYATDFRNQGAPKPTAADAKPSAADAKPNAADAKPAATEAKPAPSAESKGDKTGT